MRENWFLLGDIHGETAPIEYFYIHNKDRLKLDECENHLILLGDVGCNFCITGERMLILRGVSRKCHLHISVSGGIMKPG